MCMYVYVCVCVCVCMCVICNMYACVRERIQKLQGNNANENVCMIVCTESIWTISKESQLLFPCCSHFICYGMYTFVRMHICIYVYVCMYMYVWMYVCMNVCMYISYQSLSPKPAFTSVAPLLGVLAVTALKEGIEDHVRCMCVCMYVCTRLLHYIWVRMNEHTLVWP